MYLLQITNFKSSNPKPLTRSTIFYFRKLLLLLYLLLSVCYLLNTPTPIEEEGVFVLLPPVEVDLTK